MSSAAGAMGAGAMGSGAMGSGGGVVRPAAVRSHESGIVTRLLAALVDVGVVGLLMALLYLGVVGLSFMWSPIRFQWPRPDTAIGLIVTFLVTTAYLTTGWATVGRTSGAGLLGVRVLSRRGELLGWPRAMLRAVLCIVFPIGLLWAAVSRARHSVQDILVRSTVVYDWQLRLAPDDTVAAHLPDVASRDRR